MAGEIIRQLLAPRWTRAFVLPNYTPSKWWECDVFEVTEAGYFREYEVKISRGDFFADSGKANTRWETVGREGCTHTMVYSNGNFSCRDCGGKRKKVVYETKHGLIKERSERGPSQFFYVVPSGLIELAEVPGWAGLIVMEPTLYGHREVVVRQAMRLHRTKIDPKIVAQAKETCYYRFHRLHRRVPKGEEVVEEEKTVSL